MGGKKVLLTVAAIVFILFVLLPLTFSLFSPYDLGNVALIKIDGPITIGGGSLLGQAATSSSDIVAFIREADAHPQVEVIVLEINSPGGSAVASDEIAQALGRTKKPTVSLIRESGASGAYWVAAATDHIIANRLALTGSIGVISSYPEFSGLMEEYGVGYERLVAGDKKDIGTPFRKLNTQEKAFLQQKIDKLHAIFIDEVAELRNLPRTEVKRLATGEFYLGMEALDVGLVDALGDQYTLEEYLKTTYDIKDITYVKYQKKESFLSILQQVFSPFSFGQATLMM